MFSLDLALGEVSLLLGGKGIRSSCDFCSHRKGGFQTCELDVSDSIRVEPLARQNDCSRQVVAQDSPRFGQLSIDDILRGS
jgi:hypothetical protein